MDLSANTKSQLEMSRSVHDLSSIDKLRSAAQQGDDGALEEAAKQFEAIFVKMLLKSMRQAQDALADKDSPFNSDQVKFYRDMHDQQMATDLSTKGSIGLADLIVQQMSHSKGYMPASVVRNDGDVSILNRQTTKVDKRTETQASQQISDFKQALFDTPKEFVKRLFPLAQAAAEKLNIDPKALIAQAAVETGWGKYVIQQHDGKSSHNLFGIKADQRWSGDKAVVDTLEYVNDLPKKQQAAFRSYADLAASLNDYVDFVKSNPRYQQATKNSQQTEKYFSELQEAGYATDPQYAEKVMAVYRGELLNELLP